MTFLLGRRNRVPRSLNSRRLPETQLVVFGYCVAPHIAYVDPLAM